MVFVSNDIIKASLHGPLNIPNSYRDINLFMFTSLEKQTTLIGFESQKWIWRTRLLEGGERKAFRLEVTTVCVFSWAPAFIPSLSDL